MPRAFPPFRRVFFILMVIYMRMKVKSVIFGVLQFLQVIRNRLVGPFNIIVRQLMDFLTLLLWVDPCVV